MGYDEKEKIGYANTEKIESILSYEDGKIFYYKEFYTKEREIVEYDLKNQKIINSLQLNDNRIMIFLLGYIIIELIEGVYSNFLNIIE